VTSDVLELFCELAAIPSPPGDERAVADRVALECRDLGLEVSEDGAGPRVGGNTGNMLARLPATVEGTSIFLCAHLDTVSPTAAIEPVVEGGIVRNSAGTILGGDDKSAVATMLVAAQRILNEGIPHAGLELVFTVKEETGLEGAKELDLDAIASPLGYCYDHAGPPGEIVFAAPSSTSVDAVFTGRAAHAGMHPEEGRSAIAAAARAIADLRLGRIDDETTANVGVISGGTARNIVPEFCSVVAEARSHDEAKLAALVQEMVDSFTFAAAVAETEVDVTLADKYRAYRFKADDPVVRLASAAFEATGLTPSGISAGGGADANVFNERGRPCANLANGMSRIHSPDEFIAVADLETMVEVTLALVEAARA
jgi:tripeptide aminopeptidase